MRSPTLELETALATAANKQAISSIIIVADIVPTTPAPTTPSEKSISPVLVVVHSVPSIPAPTSPTREAIPAINNVDAAPKIQAPFTLTREFIPGIHDVRAVSTTLTPFTPAIEVILPIDVFGTLTTAREPPRHVSGEVAATADITKIDSINNEPLVRPVTYDIQSLQEPELLVQKVTGASTVGDDNARDNGAPQNESGRGSTAFQCLHEPATGASPALADDGQQNRCSQYDIRVEATETQRLGEAAAGTATDVAPQENGIATGHQDDASVIQNDNHVADMDVEMAQDDGELDYLAKYLAKDEDTSVAAAVACQMTDDDQMEMQAAFDEYFAALDAGTVKSSTGDIDPFAVATLPGKLDDADQMEVEVTVERRPAALPDTSALTKIEQTTQHNIDTDMMIDVPHQAFQEHCPRVFSTTEKAVLHDLDTVMTDGIVHGTPEKHNLPNPFTTERVSLRHFELDDVMHDAIEEHDAAAPSTTAQEIDMVDDFVHQAAEKHDTEMRDAPRKSSRISARQELDTEMRDSPEKRHRVSTRGILPDPVVNIRANAVPPTLIASQSSQGYSAAQRRVTSPIVQPIFVSNNASVPALASQNSQIHPASQVSNKNPPVQPHLVRNNAPVPVAALLNSQARSAAQVSASRTRAQPLRARSNAFVSATPYLNGTVPHQNPVTRTNGTANQQRASHNSGKTSNFPISHVGPPVQQARPSAQQGPSRPPAARVYHEEEPVEPWADQKVKVHKNKSRGRKKAEDESKTLANIIARYSLPPPPQPQGNKRELYIDHYGPDAYRERVDGNNGNGGE